MLYNEIKLLEFRLAETSDVTDHYVIVEANITFSGKPKPFHLEEAMKSERFSKYKDKIVYVKIESMPDTLDPWGREAFQRNRIYEGVDRLSLSPEDFVLMTDLDEIPDSYMLNALKTYRVSYQDKTPFRLTQDFYYYNFNCKSSDKGAVTTAKLFKYKDLTDRVPIKTLIFDSPYHPLALDKWGWHLSYFGDVNAIAAKIKAFSHTEYDTDEFTSPEKVLQRVEACADLFDREHAHGFRRVEVTSSSYLPKNYKMLL